MMKHANVLTLLLITVLLLSACEGELLGSQDEEMVFTDDEVADIPEDVGMDFTDEDDATDEGEGFDFTDEDDADENPVPDNPDPDDDEGFVFDEDEVPTHPIFPPLGKSTWLVNHGEGQMVCASGLTMSFEGGDIDTIEIEAGSAPDMDLMIIENFDGEGTLMEFWRYNVSFSLYKGTYEIPGTDSALEYEMIFDSSTGDGDVADIMSGTISSEAEGCLTTRGFAGTIVE